MTSCKAHATTVKILLEGFQHFSKVTGLQANTSKSQNFVAGAQEQVCTKIAHLTGFGMGSFPIKYLGIPLSPRRWTKAECGAVIEKIAK